ncbi:flagellar type III secretion system pore protein FliP [Qipengyuania thermophila]|uniref:flagellar type III secretion system pore protein FliP n=1 Tax=Qipengyuania thermophila TaxID=2509361 RepID=UPI0018F86A0D|nr:flagellar type III secretion system pore protein FliP [Qipengyuania thermophila]
MTCQRRCTAVAWGVLVALLAAGPASAAEPVLSLALDRALGAASAEARAPLSLSLQLLLVMGALTLLPGLLLMMTSFTRIIIVLSLLRQALGLQQSPPNQVLIGLALLLSMFVMAPTLDRVQETALAPYAEGRMTGDEAIAAAGEAFHGFMLRQTRTAELEMFADLAGHSAYRDGAAVPFSVLLPAFVTSELKTAFQIGFMLFLPFLAIDLVVAGVLMSLGMMMLSPTLVSLPFKLLLFVLIDGWSLLMGSLAMSFL